MVCTTPYWTCRKSYKGEKREQRAGAVETVVDESEERTGARWSHRFIRNDHHLLVVVAVVSTTLDVCFILGDVRVRLQSTSTIKDLLT